MHGGDEDYSVMIVIVIKITVCINNLNEWINVRMKGYHQEQE